MKLLLTGAPRSGKSTLVRRLVEGFPGNAGGMMVVERRGADGRRCGFDLQAVWRPVGRPLQVGEQAPLAWVAGDGSVAPQWGAGGAAADPAATLAPGCVQVGRYLVDPGALDLAVRALDAAMHEGGLVIIDEIGPLQLVAPAFGDAVLRCLDSQSQLLATLAQFEGPFAAQVKARPGVRVIEVTRQNRQHLAESLPAWVSGQHRI